MDTYLKFVFSLYSNPRQLKILDLSLIKGDLNLESSKLILTVPSRFCWVWLRSITSL